MATTCLFAVIQGLTLRLNISSQQTVAFNEDSGCLYQVQHLLPSLQRSCRARNKIHLTSDFLPPQALMSVVRVQFFFIHLLCILLIHISSTNPQDTEIVTI
jgi:hypothetical protein